MLISSSVSFSYITLTLGVGNGEKNASKLKFCISNNFDCSGSSLFKKSYGKIFCKLSHWPFIGFKKFKFEYSILPAVGGQMVFVLLERCTENVEPGVLPLCI